MTERKREGFLDRLRVAATCAVVLLHTVTGIMDITDMTAYPLERRVFLVVLDLVCWCVPVFVLISGYLFLNPTREFTFGQMITKYCRRIVLALLLFGVPFAWIEQVALTKSLQPEMFLQGFLMVLQGKSWSHLWYLYLVLVLYLLTPGMKWLLKRLPVAVVYLVLFVLFVGSSLMPFAKKFFGLEQMSVLPDGGIYFFYYICGYLFAIRGQKKKESGRMYLLPAAVIVLAVGMVLSRVIGDYQVQMAYNYPFTVVMALLLFGWGLNRKEGMQRRNGNIASLSEKKADRIWTALSALSFAVYLVHPVFLNVYYKFLHISPLTFHIWLSLPLFFAATLLPAVLAAWVMRKISPLRKWVL